MNTPTIGIEIEIPWPAQLISVSIEAYYELLQAGSFYKAPPDAKKKIQDAFDEVDRRYKKAARSVLGDQIREAGGCDGYLEYSFAPSTSPKAISSLVDDLYAKDILRDHYYYPLHVTFGGISASQYAWIILCCMELFGGTTPERLLEVNTWSKKGTAGIKDRHPAELELDAIKGVELRSLVLKNPYQLRRILTIGQLVGVEVMNNTLKVKRLQNLFVGKFKTINLPCYQWKNPQDDQAPWIKLAEAFDDPIWINNMRRRISGVVFS